MKHYFQPDQYTCVQTATAIFLSHYGINKTPQEIIDEVPVRSWPDKPNVPAGTPNQDISTYLLSLGFSVEIISFDLWVTDLAWQGKDTAFIRKRLEEASGELTAPMIGRSGTELYIQAYLDFIKAGGELSVQTYPSVKHLELLLKDGPLISTAAYGTLHGTGKDISNKDRTATFDDIKGKAANHNIVLSGYADGEFEFYDPWASSKPLKVPADQLIAAIATAQQECDNMLVVPRLKG